MILFSHELGFGRISGMFAWLLLAVLITSLISGVLGMAGGMILMGIYGLLLPVGTAMVLHGVTQLAANGARAYLFRKHVDRHVVAPFLAGSVAALALFGAAAFVPDRAAVFLGLGALPFLGLLKPKRLVLDVTRPFTGFVAGLLVTATQLLAGVSGPLLDLFFLEAPLNRHQVIGAKAVTQTFGHALKLVYYARLTTADVPAWLFAGAILLSFAGTWLGRNLVERVSEAWFRRATSAVVLALGVIYLLKGISEL